MIKKYFNFSELGTNYKQETIGGLTTFATMAYIVIVNPKILQAAGMPFAASFAATIISAFFGTMLMGLYAKKPFAIAPYMGENAFVAFTVVRVLGYSWQTAIGAIFVSGVLFTLLTVFNVRKWLAKSIPEGLKIGFAVGIGIFLIFIGLNETGIVALGVAGAPVKVGNLKNISVLLSIFTLLLISFLMIRKIKGAILIGIAASTALALILKITPLPGALFAMPPSIEPVFLKLNIAGVFTMGFFSVILTVFVMDFVDTIGTLIGLSVKADLMDKEGNIPEIEKPMLCDALSTVAGSLLGTTTCGIFIESASGIEAGAKSGFASVITALLFLLTLFFSPIVIIIPKCAYGPALIVVGMMMISPIIRIKFEDLSESIAVLLSVTLMSFTYNLGIGITAGFIIYPLLKITSGKLKEINSGTWVLAALSLSFYIFYPY